MQNTIDELKKISKDAIPLAIEKAERYRLLNQSWATESICLDILEISPGNQPVLVLLLLSITDQFGAEYSALVLRARGVLERISGEYERHYYDGIIHERLGRAQLAYPVMHGEAMAYASLRSAMEAFERAEKLRPAGNDDAILRWNACVRTLEQLRLQDETEGEYAPVFGE
jgi:hypothetical protein